MFSKIHVSINLHLSQERRKKDGLGDLAWTESKKPVGHYKGCEASCQISCFFCYFLFYPEKNLVGSKLTS